MTEREKAVAFNRETRDALRTVYNELNQGQRQKLLRATEVNSLFGRYGVLKDDENT